jgi:hypothetical protein
MLIVLIFYSSILSYPRSNYNYLSFIQLICKNFSNIDILMDTMLPSIFMKVKQKEGTSKT